MQVHRIFILLVISLLLLPGSGLAENVPLSQHEPKLCTGELRYPDRVFYGYQLKPKRCPENHVLLGNHSAGRPKRGKPGTIQVFGYCCPLPADDILTNEVVEAISECPQDFVAIGARQDCKECSSYLICSKINQNRYRLSNTTAGLSWGFSSAPFRQAKSILKNEIPAGLRQGVTRDSQFDVHSSGCVGYPFGSILTKKSGKYCHQFFYRQLLFRGLKGDPRDGTAVKMFPDCVAVAKPFSGEEICVK